MSKNKSSSSSSSSGKKGTASTPLDVVITVGLPGSGKSTFSKLLASQSGGKWVHVSQDELGTQDECRKAIAKALKHRQPLVFDRCCVLERERRLWLQCFRDCPGVVLHAVFFDVPPAECLHHTTHTARCCCSITQTLKNRQGENPCTRKASDAEWPGGRRCCGRLCTELAAPSAPGRLCLCPHSPQQRRRFCPLQAAHINSCTKTRGKTKVNNARRRGLQTRRGHSFLLLLFPLFRHQPMKTTKQTINGVFGFWVSVVSEATVNE